MSGNRAYKSEKVWRHAITRAVNDYRKSPNGRKQKALVLLANKLVSRALEGDIAALKEIGDRLDGRPVASVEVEDGDDLQITVVKRVIIESDQAERIGGPIIDVNPEMIEHKPKRKANGD